MPRTWDRSRFAPWLLRELVQMNEKTTSHLSRANSLAGQWLALTRSAILTTTKRRAQIGGSRRRRDAAAQDIVGRNWPAVVALVRAFARADYCALERSANEKAFALAVSINRCSWCDVRFRSASHWSSGNTRVRAKRHVSTLGKRLNRAFGVEDDDKIGHLRTNLRPPPAPPVPMNDGPDQPCPVRATTTPSPAFALKIRPAFTTLMMARPRALIRMCAGMPRSGMCRNSRIVPAERSNVCCSVAFAATSDKEKIVRTKNNFVMDVQVLRGLDAARLCLSMTMSILSSDRTIPCRIHRGGAHAPCRCDEEWRRINSGHDTTARQRCNDVSNAIREHKNSDRVCD